MTDGTPEHSGHAKDLTRSRENVLIVIGGGSASGKSTLASMIEENAEDAVVLSMDDYYKDETDYSRDHPNSIDWGELKTSVIRLLNGRVTNVPRFDFDADERTEGRSMKPADLVIVEGLWACDTPDRLGIIPDENAYVYVGDELRLARRVLRDVKERGCELHDVVDRWQSEVRPHHDQFVESTIEVANHTIAGRSDRAMEEFTSWLLNHYNAEA